MILGMSIAYMKNIYNSFGDFKNITNDIDVPTIA